MLKAVLVMRPRIARFGRSSALFGKLLPDPIVATTKTGLDSGAGA